VKEPILNKATKRLLLDPKFASLKEELTAFREAESWVEESALFYALANFEETTKERAWWTWPSPLRCLPLSPPPSPVYLPPRLDKQG